MWVKRPLLFLAILGFLPAAAWADSISLRAAGLESARIAGMPAASLSTLAATRSSSTFRSVRRVQPFSLISAETHSHNDGVAALVSLDNGTLSISVPEPGGLAMFSTGMVWIARLVNRRRLNRVLRASDLTPDWHYLLRVD